MAAEGSPTNGSVPASVAAAAPDGPEFCAAARARALEDFKASFTALDPAAALAQMQEASAAQGADLIITSGPVAAAEPGDDNHDRTPHMTVMLCCGHHDCARAGTSNAALSFSG